MPRLKSISREAMRELDRATIEDIGIPARMLMECAGRAVVDEVLHFLRAEKVGRAVRGTLAISEEGVDDTPTPPQSAAEIDEWKAELRRVRGPVGVICGPGNNGGDGFVVARTLVNHGVDVSVIFVGRELPRRDSGDAGANALLLKRLGINIHHVSDSASVSAAMDLLRPCLVVVDALFGTGLTRSLEGSYLETVRELNLLDKPVIAVDIPSGLDANEGTVHGAAVLADVTVTFAIAKHGLLQGHGPDQCGRLSVVEMGIPRALIDAELEKDSTREH